MSKKYKKDKKTVWKAAILVGILGILLFLFWMGGRDQNSKKADSVQVEHAQTVNLNLGNGLEIEEVAGYTGRYMEDGTDEVLSDILMIRVKNTGSNPIQYAEIEMPEKEKTAYFTLSTLPAGESMIVLEKNRMTYEKEMTFSEAKAQNVAFFQQALSLCEDKLEIQTLNGTLNVTNISGEDIAGDVMVYYKNSSTDLLYGGITYRVSITGGIKAGETRQIAANHFSTAGSRILFVTCG